MKLCQLSTPDLCRLSRCSAWFGSDGEYEKKTESKRSPSKGSFKPYDKSEGCPKRIAAESLDCFEMTTVERGHAGRPRKSIRKPENFYGK